ncbi:hypothetical protein TSOC_013374, partial [Tetrabaena socialis]
AVNHMTEREARYTGVLDAVVQILRREGIAAFYKGLRRRRPGYRDGRARAAQHACLAQQTSLAPVLIMAAPAPRG